jgi:hypothetical protein
MYTMCTCRAATAAIKTVEVDEKLRAVVEQTVDAYAAKLQLSAGDGAASQSALSASHFSEGWGGGHAGRHAAAAPRSVAST